MNNPRPERQQILRGILLVSIAVLMFAIMDAMSKYLTRFYPVTYIVWVRFFVHTVLLLAILGPRLGLRFLRTSRPGIHALRGVLLPFSAVCFVLATKYMPIAEASAITFVGPLVVTMLAVAFLKEKVTRGHWLAIFLGFVGVLIIIRPGSGVFTWASLLPLCTAISTACYQVLTRRIAHRESVYTSIFYPGFGGMLIFGLLLPFSWTLPQSALHVVLLVLVGVIGTSSHLILIKAFDHASASRLAPFTYSHMIWATVIGYFVFGNFPDFWSLAGIAILAACGIYLVTHLRQSNG